MTRKQRTKARKAVAARARIKQAAEILCHGHKPWWYILGIDGRKRFLSGRLSSSRPNLQNIPTWIKETT